jgi:hypothetical protein
MKHSEQGGYLSADIDLMKEKPSWNRRVLPIFGK